MENLRDKWSLITGASSGFGVQFAKLLAARKSNLVLTARRTEPMERLAAELRQKYGVDIAIEGMDLARPGAGTELTYLFAADMVERRAGHILLIASLLGYQAVPGYAVYAATKAYVLLLGEALHQELQPHGVAVTALCPGPSATSFGEVAGAKTSPLLNMMTMDPQTVAEAGIRAMLARDATMVPGVWNKTIVFLNRLMPRAMQRAVFGKVTAG